MQSVGVTMKAHTGSGDNFCFEIIACECGVFEFGNNRKAFHAGLRFPSI